MIANARNKSYLYIVVIIITSQDKLVHNSSAEIVLIGVELRTLRFQADVTTHYTTNHSALVHPKAHLSQNFSLMSS